MLSFIGKFVCTILIIDAILVLILIRLAILEGRW